MRAARAVAAAPGPAEAYKTVLPMLHGEPAPAVARLWLREPGGDQMVCVDWIWTDPRFETTAESPFGVVCSVGEGVAGVCWEARKLISVRVAEHPELFPNLADLTAAGIDTTVAVPLEGIADLVGVLALYYEVGHKPTASDLAELGAVGATLGAVLESKQLAAVAREQMRRDQLLLSASSAVGAAADYEQTLRMLAASAVPGLADLCLIDLVNEDGVLERAAAVHADPAKAALMEELKSYYAPEMGSLHPAGQVTTSGQSSWSAHISEEFLQETSRDQRHYEIVRALGFTSYLSVPLRVGGRVLGAITLVSAGSGRVFGEADVAMGERLASQVAGTIARARERELAQQRSAELQARNEALMELGSQLSGAQVVEEALDALLASPVCSLGAKTARIGLLDEANGTLQLTFAGKVQAELASRYHVIAMNAPAPTADVVKSRRRMLIPDTTKMSRRYPSVAADISPFMGAVAFEPLLAEDGSSLGAFGLSWEAPRSFSPDDIEMLDAVGVVLSRAVARIRVAQREHEVAASLQERLLALEGCSSIGVVAGVYRPYGGTMRVGGDWYTARVLEPGQEIGVSVGDVVGHGLDAVTTMSQLRSALEAAALTQRDPAGVLALLDRYAQAVPGASCATAAYARVDAASGRVHYACAGHPYPLIVHPDGQVQYLTEGRTPPLGIDPAVTGQSGQAELPSGSLLILYSDGLIERHGESLEAGLERLAAAAGDCRQLSAQMVCPELLDRLAPPAGYTDDVVVVALRPTGVTADSLIECVPARLEEIAPARHRLRAWLAGLGVDRMFSYELLLAVGEAVNNAVEHAGPLDPRRFVAVEAFADEQRIEVSVTDTGSWTKDSAVSRRSDERGRGLTLIHGLSDQVDTVRSPFGTRVTMTFRMGRPSKMAQASGVSSS